MENLKIEKDKICILTIGMAGSGKTTFVQVIINSKF